MSCAVLMTGLTKLNASNDAHEAVCSGVPFDGFYSTIRSYIHKEKPRKYLRVHRSVRARNNKRDDGGDDEEHGKFGPDEVSLR